MKTKERVLGYDINKKPVLHVDATPNDDYPIRILEAYRENCDCFFSTSNGEPLNPLLAMMNEHQIERAAILDKAIDKLRS